MTPTLPIDIGLALAALTGIGFAAWRDRRRPQTAREPETRPPRLRLHLVRHVVRAVRYGGQPAGLVALGEYRPPVGTAPAPVRHIGATEDFGDELHALGEVQVCPELETEVEAIARYHTEFDQMMADFRFDLDHITGGVCRRLDPHWQRVDADTSEWDVAGLRALLDAEDLAGVAA